VPAFTTPTGTFDVLPPASSRYAALVALFAARAQLAGYQLILTPLFEDVEVFTRVGESTDIVRKELYDFEDKGGRRLALRPEGTAGVVRAYVQHRPTTPCKLWYAGPYFRYERPQAGRYRQHHQLGVEALGSEDPDLDAEVIALAAGLLHDLGLRRVELRLTSLGDAVCRPPYRQELLSYLEARRDRLCEEHRPRVAENPLRILDCKRPPCREVSADAPRLVDRLCEPCRHHFERVKEGLQAFGVDFVLDSSLVRGLDYYTRTTFEFEAAALDAAQSGAGGGGRYDGLAEALGGPPTPGIGFGLGIERILLACDAEGTFPPPAGLVDAYVVDLTGGAAARDLSHDLRQAGVRAERGFGDRSLKAQLKAADRSGARLALIVGPDEMTAGTVTVRDLRRGDQETVDRSTVVDHVRKRTS
jgi:histidyl-tRNA synthetase